MLGFNCPYPQFKAGAITIDGSNASIIANSVEGGGAEVPLSFTILGWNPDSNFMGGDPPDYTITKGDGAWSVPNTFSGTWYFFIRYHDFGDDCRDALPALLGNTDMLSTYPTQLYSEEYISIDGMASPWFKYKSLDAGTITKTSPPDIDSISDGYGLESDFAQATPANKPHEVTEGGYNAMFFNPGPSAFLNNALAYNGAKSILVVGKVTDLATHSVFIGSASGLEINIIVYPSTDPTYPSKIVVSTPGGGIEGPVVVASNLFYALVVFDGVSSKLYSSFGNAVGTLDTITGFDMIGATSGAGHNGHIMEVRGWKKALDEVTEVNAEVQPYLTAIYGL